MSDELYRIRQLERRVSNLIRGGVVAEVQAKPPRVRVEYDIDENDEPVISAWLRYYEERNGHVSTWNPPKIGEQATIIAPNGDLSMGRVILGLSNSDNPPISTNLSHHVTRYDDGTELCYDRENHHLTVTIVGDATWNANTVYLNANLVQKGNYTTTGTITADKTIKSKTEVIDKTGSMSKMRTQYNGHTHGGDSGGTTSKPKQGMN